MKRIEEIGWWLTLPRFFKGVLHSGNPSEYWCALELDINSDAHRTEDLPQQSVASLLDELVSLGTEISVEGDIP